MLTIAGLTKTYGCGVRALRGIDLAIEPGMFGLLGPNGAGKSTLMKILATLLEPDAGTAHLNGLDLIKDKDATRRLLGYLPQEFGLYPTFTAVQMLSYLATLKGITDAKERRAVVDALLERVNLSAAKKRRLGGFSGGMRQRLGIAQALLGQPKLLIVDEPTAGLDPEERLRFHNLLAEISADVVVILSTHIVSDVSALCRQMAIIREGEIVAEGAPAAAMKKLEGRVWETLADRAAVAEWKSRLQVMSAQASEGQMRLRVLSQNGSPGEGFTAVTPTLEDYYFSLVGQAARED